MKSELITIAEFKEILENCSPDIMFRVYHKDKGKPNKAMKKAKKNYTLNQIGEMVLALGIRMDNLESDVRGIKQDIKRINARLDYNNLKDLPLKAK